MIKYVFLVIHFQCVLTAGVAQAFDIKPFIKAWSASDTSQTHKAEATYKYLKENRDVGEYRQILKQMYAYLKTNPDDRLWVRTTMFDIYGKIELGFFKPSDRPKDASQLFNCIKIASLLKDEQLKAELYALYAEVSPNSNDYALYNLKAIALQQKIGSSHFAFGATRYFNVAYGLYLNEDYKQSINYGLKLLSIDNAERNGVNLHLYVLANDIIGASYFGLNRVDSAKCFYQGILDTLGKKSIPNPEIQQLWLAIAKGNIGRGLALQNRDAEALPLIEEHLRTSLRLKSDNNVAMAENNLGKIYLKQKQYEKAQKAYKNAYAYAIKSNILKEKSFACKGLTEVFRGLNQTDSAFAYNALHQKYREQVIVNANEGKLSTIKASIAFDTMEASLENAESLIQRQRLTRNFILFGIALLTLCAYLVYNRKMLKQKNVAATLAYKQQLLEQEAIRAKGEIKNFIDHIAEKNNLINNLQQKLSVGNDELHQRLSSYTFITDSEWERFRTEFSNAYPDFLPALRKMLPTINPAEESLATLLCLKLTTDEISSTLGISKDSVARSKRRLKQRLDLNTEDRLEDFICQLG